MLVSPDSRRPPDDSLSHVDPPGDAPSNGLVDTDETVDCPDDPFFHVGSREHACLLVHGSTGTPGDVRGLGDHLHAAGFAARGIALPGHARRPAQLAGIGWQDCYFAVHEAWAELRRGWPHVHVIGFSFGGSLALHLAAHEPVEDLVLLAPGLHVNISPRHVVGASLGLVPGTSLHARLRWNLKLLAFFRILVAELDRVSCPALLMHAKDDPLVRAQSSIDIHARIASREKRLVLLEQGGHLLPWGPAHRRVWDEVTAHLERQTT